MGEMSDVVETTLLLAWVMGGNTNWDRGNFK